MIGDPAAFAERYYNDGVDEVLFMDSVASLYGRNQLTEIIQKAARNIFVPITVGGGIRSTEDVKSILRSGADKVAINTAACANPEIIRQVAETFGTQCIVLSVEAKQIAPNKWEAFTNNGRDPSGRDVIDWVTEAVSLGAGEILLTSVDRDGTRKGFDLDLIKAVSATVSVPVIASGGMGKPFDLIPAVNEAHADAVAISTIIHYQKFSLQEIRTVALKAMINVRTYS